MSRSGAGTYTLPAGNPVVTNSVISSTWANTTLADIASALTDSLSRSGLGSMTAGLQLFDGTIGLPGLTFATETTAGLRRASAGNFRFVIGGVDVLTITSAGLTGTGVPTLSAANTWTASNTFTANGTTLTTSGIVLNSSFPLIYFRESDAAANNRVWLTYANGEQFISGVQNDADNASVSWLIVDRTANVIDQIALAATTVAFGASNLTGSGTGAWSGRHTYTLARGASQATPILLSSAFPFILWDQSTAAANNRYWDVGPVSEQLLFRLVNDADNTTTNWLTVDRTGTTVDNVVFPTNSSGAFRIAATPASSINSSRLTVSSGGSGGAAQFENNGGSSGGFHTVNVTNGGTAGDSGFMRFATDSSAGTERGSITFNRGATLTAYNVTSDGRLKKNIRNSADAGSIIDQIKVRAFEWKAEGNTLPHWFVAQELAPLTPYAVTVPSDPEGNWSVDPSKLVPLLVKAVQELRMRVAAMETR